MGIPIPGNHYPLKKNCRNTKAIVTTCSEIIGVPIQTRSGSPEGIPTEEIRLNSVNGVVKQIEKWLHQWITQDRIRPSQIAILSPFIRSKSSLIDENKLAKTSITESLESWKQGEGILFSTIRSFKGMEADLIILIDLPVPDTNAAFTTSDYYVASSRAKHLLKIIHID